MQVLVTGASGFVGGATVAALRAAGHVVRGTGRHGPPPGWSGEWIATGPLTAATDWRAAVTGIDAVVHLAAHVHVHGPAAADEPAFTVANVDATLALARAGLSAGVSHFVFMSSVAVYGEGRDAAFSEVDAFAPVTAYGRSKRDAEAGLTALFHGTSIRLTILRPPLVYGPGVGSNFLSLLRLADSALPLPFAGTDNRRSLVSTRNLADAVRHVLATATAGTFLVADDGDMSTGALIARLRAGLDRPPRLVHVPAALLRLAGTILGRSRQLEQLTGSFRLDTCRLASTGWVPPQTVATGLSETASWYRNFRRGSTA
ncbi:MAG: 3 beta-hydroxysteroid dehydrogenase/Delta 5--_4-isomerase [Devosia sp.]|nr:3 beta-hydroxysteroid dehydrogenase/Delta 5-->4-isomerase [Devosia sp.]